MDSDTNELTKNSTKINTLDPQICRNITTSQVVISLDGACRELIDNALDAGATQIDVQIVEYGVDLIEVSDNGTGIAPENFDKLCKPHSTSKLSNMKDFNSLSTYGFRGEALNSLAALGEIVIITRHKDSPLGTRLTFDRNGTIIQKHITSKKIGTIVFVANLFKWLPVRQMEFKRNARKEFLKMLAGMQAIAIGRIDCRFTCSNTIKYKITKHLNSPGKPASLKDVITCLFGLQIDKLNILELEEEIPNEEIQEMYDLTPTKKENDTKFLDIKLSGYVSSSELGKGRGATDRQFIYVNQRPVVLPKLNRIANEVYNSFNRKQHCMLILFIQVDPSKLDVNVSPDKQEVFLQQEKELFAKFRSTLIKTFSKVLGNCSKASSSQPLDVPTTRKRSNIEQNILQVSADVQKGRGSLLRDWDATNERVGSGGGPRFKVPKLIEKTSKKTLAVPVNDSATLHAYICKTISCTKGGQKPNDNFITNSSNAVPAVSRPCVNDDDNNDNDVLIIESDIRPNDQNKVLSNRKVVRSIQTLNFDMEKVLSAAKIYCAHLKKKQAESSSKVKVCQSDDMINEMQASEIAEKNLSIMLRRDDFNRMELVGQFNNEFIFTRLDNQLFMVDQHAADEKYNFENLRRNAKITTQLLIIPIKLDLGAVQKGVLHDNLHILQANGFEFAFCDSEKHGFQISLTSTPVVQGCHFDKDDVDEILAALTDFPGTMYRPVKLRKIFASRACRKSIMFGTALKKQQMLKIIRNMGTLNQPWNCPHGRPTIRHLCELKFNKNL